MKFVDFAELKERVSFGQAIALLGITMQKHGTQWRGPCTACKKGGDRALVVTEGKGFFCFATHTGGDVIAFVAHVRGCAVKEAAMLLARDTVPSTVPEVVKEGDKSLAPLTYLEHDHAAVLAVGFDPEIAKRLGIGYAPKGIMRGTVAIPIRDSTGALLGYIGVEEARLPSDFMGNVVPLKKPA